VSQPPPGWREANRANWDERVAIHMGPGGYNLAPLRAGKGVLNPIEEAELGPVEGLRVLHLQCHFGQDTLTLAQRGAEVVGLDFSGEGIEAARALADELGLADRARFVQADLYDAPHAIPEPAAFDRVFVTWGAINWLPDIAAWAKVVALFLKPGGALYLAEGHPAALVFDDATKDADGMPGWFWPYFSRDVFIDKAPRDYTGDMPRLRSGPTYEWVHPLSSVLGALGAAGLRLVWLHEHDAVPWPMFQILRRDDDRMWRWPDKPWLPLGYSLWAERL
jgi:SAM-dependent methyltransferase